MKLACALLFLQFATLASESMASSVNLRGLGREEIAGDNLKSHHRELLTPNACSSTSEGNLCLVADIYPGISRSSNVFLLLEFNGKLLLSASDATHGQELWEYDGVNPPSLVADLNPGQSGSHPAFANILNGMVYFVANTGTQTTLWEYDGTNPPAIVAPAMNPVFGDPFTFYLTKYNNALYFAARNGVDGYGLWKYDGVNAPSMVLDPSANPGEGMITGTFAVYDGKLFFPAANASGASNIQLWCWDGSSGYTVSAIPPATSGYGSRVTALTPFAGKLYFFAYTDSTGGEPWVYDSATNTSSMIVDLNPGPGHGGSMMEFVEYNGKLYFSGNNGVTGFELYYLDGTTVGPALAAEINPSGDGSPTFFKVFNGKLFFWGQYGTSPPSSMAPLRAFFVYDGVYPPTIVEDAFVNSMLEFNGKLYMSARVDPWSNYGKEFWSLDPFTLAPTTAPPSTSAPTTLPPSTRAPTNAPSNAPTTLSPSTRAPSTIPPTTGAPTNPPNVAPPVQSSVKGTPVGGV